jgi:hypothetical protein
MPKVRSPYAPEPRKAGKAYVKPYNHPQTGEQIGWKSSTKWGKVKYWRNTDSAKAKAMQHAGLNEEGAVNAAGAGNVAGLGVGPQGEPGVRKAPLLKRFKKFMTGK